jgi:hypothetical protein
MDIALDISDLLLRMSPDVLQLVLTVSALRLVHCSSLACIYQTHLDTKEPTKARCVVPQTHHHNALWSNAQRNVGSTTLGLTLLPFVDNPSCRSSHRSWRLC